jgi:hypothetical protein
MKPFQKSFEGNYLQDNKDSKSHNDNETNESAWERGLRHAKEMRDKAKQRKLTDKEDFLDKKMNLSLKEFEIERENDERYINIEK